METRRKIRINYDVENEEARRNRFKRIIAFPIKFNCYNIVVEIFFPLEMRIVNKICIIKEMRKSRSIRINNIGRLQLWRIVR